MRHLGGVGCRSLRSLFGRASRSASSPRPDDYERTTPTRPYQKLEAGELNVTLRTLVRVSEAWPDFLSIRCAPSCGLCGNAGLVYVGNGSAEVPETGSRNSGPPADLGSPTAPLPLPQGLGHLNEPPRTRPGRLAAPIRSFWQLAGPNPYKSQWGPFAPLCRPQRALFSKTNCVAEDKNLDFCDRDIRVRRASKMAQQSVLK